MTNFDAVLNYGLYTVQVRRYYLNSTLQTYLQTKSCLKDGRRGRGLASAAGGYYIRLTAGCPPRSLAGWEDSEKEGDGLPDYEIYLEGFVRSGSNIEIREEQEETRDSGQGLARKSAQQTNSSRVRQSGNYFSGE